MNRTLTALILWQSGAYAAGSQLHAVAMRVVAVSTIGRGHSGCSLVAEVKKARYVYYHC